MKQRYLIKKDGNHGLVIMFGGWGSGPELFGGYEVPDGYDFLLCYDYRSMDFDFSMLDGYSGVRLVAWSMGVWVAEQIFAVNGNDGNGLCGADAGKGIRWESRVAIGGTPFPIDDARGIPVNIFNGTLDTLSEATVARFRRRMCGAALEHFMSHLPDRDIDELKEELYNIRKNVLASSRAEGLEWDWAVAGGADMIFPAANQENAWDSLGVMVWHAGNARHYEPSVFRTVLLMSAAALDKDIPYIGNMQDAGER